MNESALLPALFLDRDGVINVDHGYVHKQDQFDFIPGIFDVCRTAKRLDMGIVIVTNQAGIARGIYLESDFLKLTKWMSEIFANEGCPVTHVYFSPYHPKFGIGEYRVDSECRKPKPGMILRAARELHLDLRRSVMIGNKESDIAAGRAANIGLTILFSQNTARTSADHQIQKLAAAIPIIERLADARVPRWSSES